MRARLCILLLCITPFTMACEVPDDGGGGGGTSASDQEHTAFEMCKKFVKDRLKAPESATFRNFFQDDGEVSVTGSGNGPYVVTSSVDSENSFGAKLRANFRCTVTNTSGNNWHLDDIFIDN